MLTDIAIRLTAEYLPWLDCYAFSLSCKNVRQALTSKTISDKPLVGNRAFRVALIRHLSNLGIDGEHFCQQLKVHRCYLSGSLILQVMLGVSWNNSLSEDDTHDFQRAKRKIYSESGDRKVLPLTIEQCKELKTLNVSDIDVFHVGRTCPYAWYPDESDTSSGRPKYSSPKLPRIDSKEYKHECPRDKCYPLDYTFANSVLGSVGVACASFVGDKDLPEKLEQCITSRKWVIGNSFLNAISINPYKVASVTKYIREYFDMSIVKNVFDGDELRMFDQNAIIDRFCTVAADHVAISQKTVWCNYRESTMETSEGEWDRVVNDRAAKYARRGFTITLEYPGRSIIYRPYKSGSAEREVIVIKPDI